MKRVLIVTQGTHGDLFPFLAVGRVLAARGVEVHVAANPHFEDDVRVSGLGFVPLGERIGTADFIRNYGVMHPALGLMRVLRLVRDGAPALVARTREVVAAMRPDVVFAHHNSFGAADVAKEHSIPCALAVLAPDVMSSRTDPYSMKSSWGGRPGRLFSKAMIRLGELTMMRMMTAMHDSARRKSGLPPMKDAANAAWQACDRILGMWSEGFRAPQPDDPKHARTIGFAFYDGDPTEASPPGLEEFLADGDPPLLFCLGTTAVHAPGNFYANAIDAARALKSRALLLAGPDAAQYDRPREGVRAFPYAQLSRVTSRCSVGIVHGGIGTTANVLRAGKPVLVAPFAFDQFSNGMRVHALGVGETIHAWRLNARRMTDALDRLLHSADIRARAAALAEGMRGEDGAARGADQVLELAS